jgi:DNA-directed RNA polymerase specialized sigma24 family protein
MSRPIKGDSPGYKLEKFIHGVVKKLIHSYKMSDFIIQSPSGRVDSDFRADMVQAAWVAALECQQSHPKESNNPAYLRRAVVNALLKFEQGDRKRRDSRDDIEDTLPAADRHSSSAHDVELLINKARLTPTEQLVVELTYGLNDGKEYTDTQVARMMDKTPFWVRTKLTVAKIKLQVAAGR